MASKNQDPANQNPADALNPGAGANLTDEQRKHREEVYGYKRDEEGTLDTSARLEDETAGIPSGSATTGPDPESPLPDEQLYPDFNNPIDDNNR